MNRLSICHLGKYYHPDRGGIETHVRSLALGQAERGHDVRVVCVGASTSSERDGGVSVRRLKSWGRLANLDVCPDVLNAVRRDAREADVVHLHVPNPLMGLALLARGWRGALVIGHHSDVIRQRVLRRILRPLDARLYGRARLLLSASEAYIGGSELLSTYRSKVRVLPYGLDPVRHDAPTARVLEAEAGFRKTIDAPLWLFVGRLVYYKGLEIAIRALKDVPGTLAIVGTGPLETAGRAEAERMGVAGRIAWLRDLGDEELAGAYRAAAALWFPSTSRAEGFGLVQLEAMAAGCPVINTRIPRSGVAGVSLDGESGLTIEPGRPDQLAAAARRMWEDVALRGRLSAGGQARARSEFSRARMLDRCDALYREAAGGADGAGASGGT